MRYRVPLRLRPPGEPQEELRGEPLELVGGYECYCWAMCMGQTGGQVEHCVAIYTCLPRN